jgi:hypothetical protein
VVSIYLDVNVLVPLFVLDRLNARQESCDGGSEQIRSIGITTRYGIMGTLNSGREGRSPHFITDAGLLQPEFILVGRHTPALAKSMIAVTRKPAVSRLGT